MKILKLLIAIVLIASIVMSMSGCQLIDDIIGGGTDKPSPSVSEKPTETDKPTTPSPEPTTPSPEPTTPSPEPTTPSPEPTTPSPEPTTPEVKMHVVEFDGNATAKVGTTAIASGDKVKSGSTVIFTAKAVEGKEFIKFWNNGVAISGSNPCTYTVTADMSVSPEYGSQHKLTFDKEISVINNVTGKSITSGDFIKAKTSITVKADVPQGKSFVKFFTKSSPGIILSHTSNPSTFNSYDFDYHLSVEFKDISFTYILQLGQMHVNHNISVNGQKIAFYEYEYPYPKASSGDLIRFDYLDSDMLYIFLDFWETNNYSGKHFITKQITRSEALSNGFSLPYPSYFSPEAFLYLNDIILSGGTIQVSIHGTYIKE